jgi:hypothetical protein
MYISKKIIMALMSNKISKGFLFLVNLSLCVLVIGCNNSNGEKRKQPGVNDSVAHAKTASKDSTATPNNAPPPPLDTTKYNKLLLHLVHDSASKKWPVKTAYPLPGAILPFKRIVAYYGNYYSTHMGALGEYPPDEMLKRLMAEVKKWHEADTALGVVPAIHYIVASAQASPGKGGKYILRMPFTQIDKSLDLAKKVDGIVFLDIQVGWSSLETEIPLLEPYLKLPNVHLAIDPEFSMKDKHHKPGTIIGTFDAADLNYVTDYLAKLVKKYNLPPKVFIVHRFTLGMLTNYVQIKTCPEVQFVMDMDGWGFPAKKVSSYVLCEGNNPVEFTGFKLFYKNDILTPPWKTIMKPQDVLKLYPMPVYIQYQ